MFYLYKTQYKSPHSGKINETYCLTQEAFSEKLIAEFSTREEGEKYLLTLFKTRIVLIHEVNNAEK